MYASQIWSTQFLEHDSQCFQQSFAGCTHGVFKENFESKIYFCNTDVSFENARKNSCNFTSTGSGQLQSFGIGWLI
jgi:hypothetical protein